MDVVLVRRRAVMGAAVCALALAASPACPQGWPTKPVRLVVPFPAGGPVDGVARLLAERLRADLGQAVVVDNRPGANGAVGSALVARGPADGHTLLLATTGSHAIHPALGARLGFDPVRDFAPVSLLCGYAMALVADPALPVRSLSDLLALARRTPGGLAYGSAGPGATNHLAGALLAQRAGVPLRHVPYKGNALAAADVMGGQVAFMFDFLATAVPAVESGRLRPLAVTGAARSPLLPQVPTLAEAGYPGLEMGGWVALFAPAGTPATVLDALGRAVARAGADPALSSRMRALGYEPLPGGSAALAARLQADTEYWARAVAALGVRLE